MSDLDTLKATILQEVADAADLDALERVRVSALGKKGRITAQMKQLGGMRPDDGKTAGQKLNAIKDAVQEAIYARKAVLAEAEMQARLERETIDVSLPARPRGIGHIHPISRGGLDRWENVATACRRCNRIKGGRTPEEAGMPLLAVPYAPVHAEWMVLTGRNIRGDQMEVLRAHLPRSSPLRGVQPRVA